MDHDNIADVVFVIEATAINGAYINELKSNYIQPTLECFHYSHPLGDDRDYLSSDHHSTQYGIVIYRTAANLLDPMSTTIGPFTSPQKVMDTIERLPLIGGGMESCANMAEGLATAHCCFDDLKEMRSHPMVDQMNIQKHCILICNSQPYTMPVMECRKHIGKNVEQLAALFNERKINLSIISPRKMPIFYKLFMKADGDQPITAKNYAKNIRHCVLLKGYHLKERAPSPSGNMPMQQSNQQQQQQQMSQQGPVQMDTTPGQQSQVHVGPGSMQQQQQQQQQAQQPQQPPQMNPQMLQQQQFINQNQGNPNMMQNPNFQPNVTINPQNRWLFNPNQQQQQQQGPNQVRPPFLPGGPNQMIPGQNPNSALISQLSAPPNQGVNPLLQQQQQMRLQLMNQQQQQQLQQQLQQQQAQAQAQQQQQQMNQQQQQVPNPQQQQQQQQQGMSMSNQQTGVPPEQSQMRDREKIWSGSLEWIEKSKPDQQKITRTVTFTVLANIKDNELEVKGDNWPPKLLMQLMPKHLVANIGGQFLKESKMVIFRPIPSEALDALMKVMSSGFAGCVHFSSSPNMPTCDIKVLILIYTPEKNAFLGFVPNNQPMFVERLRKVIQQKQQATGPGGNIPQQHQQQMQNPIGTMQSVLGQQQKAMSMDVQQQMQQEHGQQQQQQHYNQYAQQQMSMQQMGGGGGPGSSTGGGPVSGIGPGPSNIGPPGSGSHGDQMGGSGGGPMQQHQQQISLMQQQQQQRLPMLNPNAQQQMQQQQQVPPPHPMQQQQQQRMVRPIINNPGLRHLLQQQTTPGNQFRPQMGPGQGGPGAPVGGMVGGPQQQQQMGGPGGPGGPMGPNRQFDDNYF